MGSLKAIVKRVVKGKDPTSTSFRQVKELVEKELKDECNDEYDFESAEWKKELKGVVMEVFQKMMERSEADRDASPPPAKKTKKLPSEKESKETKTKVVPEEPEDDPDLKLLRELALAMNLVPAIYKGFGTMSIEEKKEALRERLKEKGARFKHVPTKEQIREAKAAKELAKDLEGIDTSNIIESGSRRRAASAAVLSFPKKRKAASDEEDTESASESEEELVFD